MPNDTTAVQPDEPKRWSTATFRDWDGESLTGKVEAIHRDGLDLVTVALRLADDGSGSVVRFLPLARWSPDASVAGNRPGNVQDGRGISRTVPSMSSRRLAAYSAKSGGRSHRPVVVGTLTNGG